MSNLLIFCNISVIFLLIALHSKGKMLDLKLIISIVKNS